MSGVGMEMLVEWLVVALIAIGTFFVLVGSFGLARLSQFFLRLHGPTKATTLGVGCLLIASSIGFSVLQARVSWHGLLITLFLFLTAPISAHLLVKAALRLDPSLRPPPPEGNETAVSLRPNGINVDDE